MAHIKRTENSLKAEFLHLNNVNILGEIIFAVNSSPVHCRMLSIIPDFRSQDASCPQVGQLQMSSGIAQWPCHG